MAGMMFDPRQALSQTGDSRLDDNPASVMDYSAEGSEIAGTWINKDNIACGQLLIHTLRFDDKEREVSMDCTLGLIHEYFFGFYYVWPDYWFYLVLQKADNYLQEHCMFVSLRKDEKEGLYLIADLTGSVRYTRQ